MQFTLSKNIRNNFKIFLIGLLALSAPIRKFKIGESPGILKGRPWKDFLTDWEHERLHILYAVPTPILAQGSFLSSYPCCRYLFSNQQLCATTSQLTNYITDKNCRFGQCLTLNLIMHLSVSWYIYTMPHETNHMDRITKSKKYSTCLQKNIISLSKS